MALLASRHWEESSRKSAASLAFAAPPPDGWPLPLAAAVPPTAPCSLAHGRRALHATQLPPWQRMKDALAPNPFGHLQAQQPSWGPTARPSSLQPLLKGGKHAPSSLCRPHLALSGTQLLDLPTDCVGHLLPAKSAQCYLRLGKVKNVPLAALAGRKPWVRLARVCLFDGARFHANVQEIPTRHVKEGKHSEAWSFDGEPVLVCCPDALLPKMQVYIELNVSFPLLPEEARCLPHKPFQAARQVDEVCVAWALVDLSTLPTLHSSRSLSVLLRAGPVGQRMTVKECCAAVAAAARLGAHSHQGAPSASSSSSSRNASLKCKLAPVPPSDDVAVLLPTAALASAPVARAVGLYRQLLADALGTTEGCASLAPVADPVLAAFPAILDDADLAHAFFQLWEQQQPSGRTSRVPPTPADTLARFRQCVLAVWPLLAAQAVPHPSIANHRADRQERQQRIHLYLQQHPVVGLNAAAHVWLHKPFSAEELVCGPMQGLAATV